MTLERLQLALEFVAEMTEDEFKRRAPIIYRFLNNRLVHSTSHSAAESHLSLIIQALVNTEVQAEIDALVA